MQDQWGRLQRFLRDNSARIASRAKDALGADEDAEAGFETLRSRLDAAIAAAQAELGLVAVREVDIAGRREATCARLDAAGRTIDAMIEQGDDAAAWRATQARVSDAAELALAEAEINDLAVVRARLEAAIAALRLRRDAVLSSSSGTAQVQVPSLAALDAEFAAALDAAARARRGRP